MQVWKLSWLALQIARHADEVVYMYPVEVVYAYIQISLVLLGAIATALLSFAMKDRVFEWRRSLRALASSIRRDGFYCNIHLWSLLL